jgi:hypothetical protein
MVKTRRVKESPDRPSAVPPPPPPPFPMGEIRLSNKWRCKLANRLVDLSVVIPIPPPPSTPDDGSVSSIPSSLSINRFPLPQLYYTVQLNSFLLLVIYSN